MKYIFTLLLLASAYCAAQAQNRTISGRLVSQDDGSPLPGVNIVIKGTTIGTVTDANGNYSIDAPVGSTLVFSFIGLKPREVLVTATGLTNPNQQPVTPKKKKVIPTLPLSLYVDSLSSETEGVAILTNQSPTYSTSEALNPLTIRSISIRGKNYHVRQNSTDYRREGFHLEVTSAFGLELANQLPPLQNQFAQGRNANGKLVWQGADQQELFSWGPLTRTLEFDGSNYAFDQNGKLVNAGSGKGKGAATYDATSFLQTGWSQINEIKWMIPVQNSGLFKIDFDNRIQHGIIPNSSVQKYNVSAKLTRLSLTKKVDADFSVTLHQSTGNLVQRGANLASIIGSIYRTPSTFDNENGLGADALHQNSSYLLPNGALRSHAPGIGDNPFGLVNQLPDYEKLQRMSNSMQLRYTATPKLNFTLTENIDIQSNNTRFGTPFGYSAFPSGRLTYRQENLVSAITLLSATQSVFKIKGHQLDATLAYQNDFVERSVARTDGFGFASADAFTHPEAATTVNRFSQTINRTAHELIAKASYKYQRKFNVLFSNRNYFSNTVDYTTFTNLFPAASLNVDFQQLLGIWDMDELSLYVSSARSIREAPLVFSNWAFGSTNLSVADYARFYESAELFSNHRAAPETMLKSEVGLNLYASGFNSHVSFYQDHTDNLITPVYQNGQIQVINAGSTVRSGVDASLEYNRYYSYGKWSFRLSWSRFKNEVVKINSTDEWIELAGFQSTQTVLAAGQPLGAIYGSSFQKSITGKWIIGADGFPIKDATLKMIGNPQPDWILGVHSSIEFKKFDFTFTLEYKKGGQIWNGTRSVLDYLGRSEQSAQMRQTANYVFDGVDANGVVNTLPVDFYNPAQPLTSNRWVRYGWDGVSESYIEDATAFRVSDISLSYSSDKGYWMKRKSFRISLIARNLLVITPYSGVDPNSTLFGNSTGQGLDLFNSPSTRSFHAQITFKM
ncbi:MAG: hypothetical protein HOP30_10090 [Cyclobacteriaceae bacterium]|nr:hypothetical protein [Cyclobacteriaceae bacterium]